MTSQIWVKGYKLSTVLGTVFGLLLPGLPLLAMPSGIVENSSSATSGDLLIAQRFTRCLEGDNLFQELETEKRKISLCIHDPEGGFYIGIFDKNDDDTYHHIFDATITDDASYQVTEIDDDGNEYVYYVNDDVLKITRNGEEVETEDVIEN